MPQVRGWCGAGPGQASGRAAPLRSLQHRYPQLTWLPVLVGKKVSGVCWLGPDAQKCPPPRGLGVGQGLVLHPQAWMNK